MRDGFDAWAESETPARSGQMDKEPAETTMQSMGGAMSVKNAKKLQLDMGAMSDYSSKGGAMCGGADLIPDAVKKAVEEAKKLINMWRAISTWIDSFVSDLDDEIIDNPASQPSLVAFAKQLKTMINNVKVYKDTLDSVAKALEAVGLGRRSKLKGGMAWQDVGKYAQQITQIYMWFKNNKPNLEQVLKLKSLQPYGQQVLDAVLPIFSAVGLGRPVGGRRAVGDRAVGGAKCECDRVGGMSLEEKMKIMSPEDKKYMMLAERRKSQVGLGRSVGVAFTPEEAAKAAAEAYNKAGKAQVMGGRKKRAPSARGVIVKKVMAERGLSLPQASKYVKEQGLY
jgi:hypothetical protein